MEPERLPIAGPGGAAAARRRARELAQALGFPRDDEEAVAIAVSELATNLMRYAQGGEIVLRSIEGERGVGLEVESHDRGPGIADLALALEDGYSTSGGLGSGLPGVRRLMDEFSIASDANGSVVVARKWPSRR